MTYLELVNAVLTRMREETVTSALGSQDPVVALVGGYVNDAKRVVEDAHTWNALRVEEDIPTVAGQEYIALPSTLSSIESVLSHDGNTLSEVPRPWLNKQRKLSSSSGDPMRYAVDGVVAITREKKLGLWPTPDAVNTLSVYGIEIQPDFSIDNDILYVPSKPVIYLALAYALRERGEVGGQTAAEVFGMASQYLSDAIAKDAALDSFDDIWYS
jgi:hypothetical protein